MPIGTVLLYDNRRGYDVVTNVLGCEPELGVEAEV
jgi:hypothetical protein